MREREGTNGGPSKEFLVVDKQCSWNVKCLNVVDKSTHWRAETWRADSRSI